MENKLPINVGDTFWSIINTSENHRIKVRECKLIEIAEFDIFCIGHTNNRFGDDRFSKSLFVKNWNKLYFASEDEAVNKMELFRKRNFVFNYFDDLQLAFSFDDLEKSTIEKTYQLIDNLKGAK